MHYKRKGHRGRHKKNTMDNNNGRIAGNSAAGSRYCNNHPSKVHVSRSVRNRPDED